MNTMRAPRRFSAITRALVALPALVAGCADRDHTDVCLGPGCTAYQGSAGRNTLASGAFGGFGGGDGGVDAPDAAAPAPVPCAVAFLSPQRGDGGALTLAGDDDVDGEACGPSFSARVLVVSNAASVNLFVNDNPLGGVRVTGGVARFDAALGNRGDTGNTLRAEATMADGRHCSAAFGESVFVGCAGPSCSIDSPRANREGFLNDSQDGDDATPGLQTDIVVTTEAENVGRAVHLQIDGTADAVPSAAVVADGAEGRATFPGVTLEEGSRSVRAECRDASDVVTLSPITEWKVDLSSCSLEVESIANGADPITPADDLDRNAGNGLNVLVRGTVEGADCNSVQIGPCGSELEDIRLHGLLDPDGGFIVPIRLAAATGSVELCARVKDDAGNLSHPDVELEVAVRADSPSVAIVSPAANTRFNRNGTSGAVGDEDPSSEASCEIDVLVACTDVGVGVDLLADGEVLGTEPCVARGGLDDPFAGVASFSSVSLDSNDDGATTALVARQSVPGLPAGVSSTVIVKADCNAPACSFASPDPSESFLGSSSGSSGSEGLQVDIVVATSASAAGEDMRLRVDGDPSDDVTQPAVAGGSSASATFTGVTLSEGPHDVQAFCTDAAGNVETASTSWTVDLTPCTTTLEVANGHDPIAPSDDLDGTTADLQVSVTGQTSGSGCSAARVGLCDSMGGPFTDLSGGSFALATTLPSAAASGLGVCAEVRDEAGNVASQSALVNVRVEPPTVAFLLPAPAATFNVASGCATTALVSCSEDGAPVELFADGLSQGTQICAGSEASFNVTLLTKNDGSTTQLSAIQTAQNVPSAPASVSVQADCEAPVLSVGVPSCASQLALRGDDVDTNTAGLQLDVNVFNGGEPDVILSIVRGTTSNVEVIGDTTSTTFPAVDLGGAGSVSLLACATDPQGNQGCATSCALTVTAEPAIAITNPRPPAVFTIEHDCDPLPGLQIPVQGTSDAADGSPVTITIGTGTPSTPSLAGGAFSACVQAPDGEDQTLTATVTDTLTNLSSTARVIVSTNTSPPPAIGAPTFTVTNRRLGTLSLSWNSVLDASNDPLVAYHLRCSLTDITTESIWDAATVFPVSTTPAFSAGVQQTQSVSNFRVGLQRFCMVRGQDAYGQLTPLTGTGPTTASVSNPFLTLAYNAVTPTTGNAARVSVSALGDINGDGNADFAYGTVNAGVQIFFGGPNLDADPDIVITSPASLAPLPHEFGANVAGLGDINGDGLPDFGITARVMSHPNTASPALANAGSVFIFFGRLSSSPWPATLSVLSSPGCGADICFHSSEAAAALGSSLTSTNFDGAGAADLVIGAQNRTNGPTQRVGRTYVVLGGSQLNVPSNTIFELPNTTLNGFTIDPSTSTRNFGVNVAGVGLGSDSRGDLVISALGRTAGGENINGEAYSVLGRDYPSGSSGLVAASPGPAFAVGTPNGFGNPMRAVGDVNNDGFGEAWVSTNFDLNGVDPVYLGRALGFSGVSLLGFTNDVVDNEWGAYMASGFHTELGRLGDLDNNGFDDVLVGSLFANNSAGTAELFYSDATTQNRVRSRADARFASSGNGQMAPGFVGDVSGDGFRDIVILDSGPALPTTRLTLFY